MCPRHASIEKERIIFVFVRKKEERKVIMLNY